MHEKPSTWARLNTWFQNIQFQGKSEYDAEYKWLNSFKSNQFIPSPEQAAPVAGLSSAELGIESV